MSFVTINEAARMGILPAGTLRRMVKTGECPGFRSGNRFLVNVELLEKVLEEKSLERKDRTTES